MTRFHFVEKSIGPSWLGAEVRRNRKREKKKEEEKENEGWRPEGGGRLARVISILARDS